VLHRFDRLTDELGLERERARGWCLLQTVAWAIGSDSLDRHLETAQWLLDEASSPGRRGRGHRTP
jgi:streptomycin 6-kinase